MAKITSPGPIEVAPVNGPPLLPEAGRPELVSTLPDHTQLPDSDGATVENFQEHPQSILLTNAILPVLNRLHPDGQFCIGQNSGIYWLLTQPPLNGCKAPDWFYVPNVPPTLDGRRRRSYVLWKERVSPRIVIEFVSGSGAEERDRREFYGKFWIYEQAIAAQYYAIFDLEPSLLEVYHRVDGTYQLMAPNEHGHFLIPEMGVALGLWTGRFVNTEWPWLRWYLPDGALVPISEELAELERQRAEAEAQRAEAEAQRADRLAAKLRELGLNPDEV